MTTTRRLERHDRGRWRRSVGHHHDRRLEHGRAAERDGGRGLHGRELRRADHRRHLGHRWRLREVLQRRDRHQRRVAADQGRRRGRGPELRGERHRVRRAPGRERRPLGRREPENDWAECLTVEQLKTIWEPAAEGTVTNWNQVDPSFPDEPLELFGAGTDSGTFDYFTDAINGEEGASRTDYTATEDDNVTVTGVVRDRRAASATSASRTTRRTPTSSRPSRSTVATAASTPSTETVQDGDVHAAVAAAVHLPDAGAPRPTPRAPRSSSTTSTTRQSIAETALFVPLTDEQQQTAVDEATALKEGTTPTT